MTDKELEQIYKEGYKAVYWTAMSFLKSEDDAEDIVQDVFVTLIKSYETIREKNKVLAWLKKTAANKCLDKIKLNKTDNVEDEFFDSIEALPEDFLPDSIIESDEARAIIVDIINNSLSEDIRRTLIMFYFNEMSTKEISEALGVPAGTVSWRINSAKKTIKKEVEKYEEKNNTKLFGMGLPFLTKLFMKEAEQVSFKPMPASLTNLLTKPSASSQALSKGAAKQIATATTKAAKEGTSLMLKKVLIGSLATMLAGSIAVVTFKQINKDDDKPKAPEKIEQQVVIKETAATGVKIMITSEPAPTTAPLPTEPVRPTMKLDGPMAQATYDALMDLIYYTYYPGDDDSKTQYFNHFTDMFEWALCDIDSDDKEELIIYRHIESDSVYDQFGYGYIYNFDSESGKWILEAHCTTETRFFDNGVLIKKNMFGTQNPAVDTSVPTVTETVLSLDSEKNKVTTLQEILWWTRDMFTTLHPNDEVPEGFNSIADGEYLYMFLIDEDFTKYFGNDYREEKLNQYIGSATEVFPEFMPLDEDFITDYVQNMHY